MRTPSSTETLLMRYLRAWREQDLRALRACLADEIRFDWGTTVCTDPDDFVAASAAGIDWSDVEILSAVFAEDRAAIVYEGLNRTDGVRVRAAEFLSVEAGAISTATVVFSGLGAA